MSGKIVLHKETQKVTSAELDVDYKGKLSACEKDLTRVVKIAMAVKRTLGLMGVTSRPLKDADLKKIGAHKDAEALIDDLSNASIEISMAHHAWDIKSDLNKAEEKSRSDLADQASTQMVVRMKAIDKEIAALNTEMQALKQRKAKLMDEIKLVTKGPREDFDKKYSDMYTSLKKVRDQNDDLRDISKAKRYVKKK